MGSQLIEGNEAPKKLWPSLLVGDITLKVESLVDPGDYVKEVSFVVRSDKPMADHEIDDHLMW